MSQHRNRLTPALLALALLVATPALPQTHRSAAPRTASFSEVVRGFLPDFLTRLWDSATPSGDSGCIFDPYGAHCAAAARPPLTTVKGDSGCILDPYGRCAPAAAAVPNGAH
jgi:hypothetical protein